MNIIVVDDERFALLSLQEAIEKAVPGCELSCFSKPDEALCFAREKQVHVAFLDIQIGGMNGLALAKSLKDIYGKTNIIFVTGYSEYALEAFTVAPSGYILKPAEPEAILVELNRLRNPITTAEPTESQCSERVRIKCFGNFNVLVNGKPLVITRGKPKELLAYLVHKRGSFSRTAEIAAVLWEDKADTASNANMRQVISRLMKILKDAGIDDIILRGWGTIAVNTEKISCDYYDFLNKKIDGINAYTGEYMSEYSWAEFTIGYLDNRIK